MPPRPPSGEFDSPGGKRRKRKWKNGATREASCFTFDLPLSRVRKSKRICPAATCFHLFFYFFCISPFESLLLLLLLLLQRRKKLRRTAHHNGELTFAQFFLVSESAVGELNPLASPSTVFIYLLQLNK